MALDQKLIYIESSHLFLRNVIFVEFGAILDSLIPRAWELWCLTTEKADAYVNINSHICRS